MENKFFSKQWFISVWDSLKKYWADSSFGALLIKKFLIPTFILFLLFTLYLFRETIFSFLKGTFPFFANNVILVLLIIVGLTALVLFSIHFIWTSPKTWRWRKIAFYVLFFVCSVDICYRPHWNLAPSQEAAIRSEERKRTDSILESWKRDDTRESKIAKKEKKDYEKQLFQVRQSLDSTVGVSLSKDQKISSLSGMLTSLRSANHFLDSLNNVKKDAPFVVRESDASPPSPPPPVKRGPKKGVPSSTKEEPKIHWVKASYKKPPGAFKN